MITMSAARMLVNAVEPAWIAPAATTVVEAEPQPRGVARLLPAAMRRLAALAARLSASRPAEPRDTAMPAARLLRASPNRPARVTLGTGTGIAPV